MQISRFQVQKLHGFLDLDIPFFEDITVIVGVNGSGKTSALTLMSELLRLDIAGLRKFKFSRAELNAKFANDVPVRLVAESTEQVGVALELTIGNETHSVGNYGSRDTLNLDDPRAVYYLDTTADSLIFPRSTSNLLLPNLFYGGSTKEAKAAVEKFLGESRLTFVQLDRTIVAMTPDGEVAADRPAKSTAKGRILEPIDEVIRVTKKKFLDYKSATEQIKDRAYRDSLRLHFEPISSSMQDRKFDRANFTQKLRDMKLRVAKSSLTSDESELKSFAASFFGEFEKLFDDTSTKRTTKRTGRRTLDEEQLDAILNLKRWQIERLLDVFEMEARSTQEAYSSIRRYLVATEKFFRESGKRLFFGPDYELGFAIDEGPTPPDHRPRSLKELSSGERQILIILTYLAFVSGKNSVFVIDEPELSLHLVWQTLLVAAVKDLRPEGCQVILATHAPEIAGRARDRTIRLGRKSLS